MAHPAGSPLPAQSQRPRQLPLSVRAVKETAVAPGSRRRAHAPTPHTCAAAFRGAPAHGRAAAPGSAVRDVLPASCRHWHAQQRRRCARGIGAAACARCAGQTCTAAGHYTTGTGSLPLPCLENAFEVRERSRPLLHAELASSDPSLEAGARVSAAVANDAPPKPRHLREGLVDTVRGATCAGPIPGGAVPLAAYRVAPGRAEFADTVRAAAVQQVLVRHGGPVVSYPADPFRALRRSAFVPLAGARDGLYPAHGTSRHTSLPGECGAAPSRRMRSPTVLPSARAAGLQHRQT